MSGPIQLRPSLDRPAGEFDPDFGLDCSYVKENAGGLALGSLDPEERTRIERHLTWCPPCALHIAQTRRLVAQLAHLAPLAAPPVSAKRRLFEAIEAQSAEPPALKTTVLPPPTMTIPSSREAMAALPAGWVERRPALAEGPRKRRFAWEMALAPLAALPLVLALTVVGGWALHTQQQMRDKTTQLALLQDENDTLENKVAAFMSASTASNVVQSFSLTSNESSLGSGPGGTIEAVANQPAATLKVWALRPTENGYQVLVVGPNGEETVGTFNVDAQGSATLPLSLSKPLEAYSQVRVVPGRGETRTATNDSEGSHDVLWMSPQGTLGSRTGTEANLTGN